MKPKRFARRPCCSGPRQKSPCRQGEEAGVCPLSQVGEDGPLRVCRLRGDRQRCARMANLGVLPGTELELLCAGRDGHCMVKINGATLSLDDLSADAILVRRR